MLRLSGISHAWLIRSYSHVGRRVVPIDPNVHVNIYKPTKGVSRCSFGQTRVSEIVCVSGPNGSLEFPVHHGLRVVKGTGNVEGEILLKVELDPEVVEGLSKHCRKFVMSMWGTTATILRNNVEGVSEGFQVPLRLVGVGYKASVEGRLLSLKVGYSHELVVPIPKDIKVTTPMASKILLCGADYQKITQFAAKLRAFRKPEPYNGRGIFVGSETIKLKEGKKK